MQARLLQVAMNLKEGHSVVIPLKVIFEAARGELTGLDRLSVRQSDIDAFCQKIQKNWEIKIYRNLEDPDIYKMYKPEKQKKKRIVKELSPIVSPTLENDMSANGYFLSTY